MKLRHLLVKAAPASAISSLADPALGYVNVTVELVDASSVTTLNPFDSLDTEMVEALAGVGLIVGSLQASKKQQQIKRQWIRLIPIVTKKKTTHDLTQGTHHQLLLEPINSALRYLLFATNERPTGPRQCASSSQRGDPFVFVGCVFFFVAGAEP
jgi:hypothetical protein